MARFSFRHPLRSILNAIFEDRPERPRPEPTGPDFFDNEFEPSETLDDAREQRIWERITREESSTYDANTHWEIFQDTGAWIGKSKAQTDQLWEDYLRSFWLTSAEPGHMRRSEWYDLAGVDKNTVDWQAWREVKHSP